jgi:hypothetical protein
MTTTPTSPRKQRAQHRAQARGSEPSTERARAEHEVWGWWAHPQARSAEDGDRRGHHLQNGRAMYRAFGREYTRPMSLIEKDQRASFDLSE